MNFHSVSTIIVAGTILTAATFSMTGCNRTEETLDVDTPAGDIDVEKNVDTDGVDVDVDENKVMIFRDFHRKISA